MAIRATREGPRTARAGARWLAAALAVAAAMMAGATAGAEELEATAGQESRVLVHVHRRGLFSAFAHDHRFEVTGWRATAHVPREAPEGTAVTVILDAASLRDREEGLSEADRRKVDAQAAGPEVLDAAHHPRIEFRADRLELAPGGGGAGRLRGVLHGTLALRGRSAPVDVAVEADRLLEGWRIRGRAKVRQSAFGIRPFSGFGGTVGVKDELEIELILALRGRAG